MARVRVRSRSFAFAQAFGRQADSAQPCRLSSRERTDANGCPESTSWGSLVRVEYRPLKIELPNARHGRQVDPRAAQSLPLARLRRAIRRPAREKHRESGPAVVPDAADNALEQRKM